MVDILDLPTKLCTETTNQIIFTLPAAWLPDDGLEEVVDYSDE